MRIFKTIVYYFFALFLIGVFSLLVLKGYKSQEIDISSLNKHSGRVNSIGIAERNSSRQKAEVFYLKLEGLEQTLGVYRMSRNYDDLLSKVSKNDFLTVFFIDDVTSDINIDLVQIEKDGHVMLAKSEYENKESYLMWIGIIGIVVILLLSMNFYYNNFVAKKQKSIYLSS
jgi:hypothetical protein